MKKILLSFSAVVIAASLSAQTTVYSATGLAEYSTWTTVDVDADGFNWGVLDFTGSTAAYLDAQGEVLGSFSYDNDSGTALTPDNWAVSPAIDLTGYVDASLSWGRAGVDASYPAENYSVYVVTGVDVTAAITAFSTATPVYTETIATGGEWVVRTADISAFDNMANVYVGIRHHDCTDMFLLAVDDVTVTGNSTASINENTLVTSAYPNPANSELNITMSENATSVAVISMDGKVVASQEVNGNSTIINVANLNSGVYFYEVTAENGLVIRNSFVKK